LNSEAAFSRDVVTVVTARSPKPQHQGDVQKLCQREKPRCFNDLSDFAGMG
jgi:hypothetical protein